MAPCAGRCRDEADEGPLERSRARRGKAWPGQAAQDPALGVAGSCLHLKHICSDVEDFRILDWLAADIESAGYRQGGDALLMHRSKKHMQIWGDALTGSEIFTILITHVLALFDLTLVDCWANLYRHGDDSKSWHHDNYQDRTPRPTVTIGVSLGQGRDLAFQHARTGQEFRVRQENGDIFAFDEPFNYIYKHSVPSAPPGTAPGRRISVILWANEQESIPRILRVRNPGMPDIVPAEFDWASWPTSSHGHLCRKDRGACSQPSLRNSDCSMSRVLDRLEATTLDAIRGRAFMSAKLEQRIWRGSAGGAAASGAAAGRIGHGAPFDDRNLARSGQRELARTELLEKLRPCGDPEQQDVQQLLRLFLRLASPDMQAGRRCDLDRDAAAVSHLGAGREGDGAIHVGGDRLGLRTSRQTAAATSFYSAPRSIGKHAGAPDRGLAAPVPESIRQDLVQTPLSVIGAQDVELTFDRVSQALTLQGAQQVLAILRGFKLSENRSWKIPRGWYAIHSGAQTISEERAARIRQSWPEAPAEDSLPHGAIVGLFFVEAHRAPEACLPNYVWARGPICHIISKAVELRRPIRSRGDQGLWSLSGVQRAELKDQLVGARVVHFDLSPVLGPDWRTHIAAA